ncbi:MAG: carboxypeptidase regulatory-like domain-containing protein, partial [Planctomycetes bacterium]|nr:carboxypeptidase regulatory-like domain-containing protein [Planctomycetota bacterium]
MILSPSRVILPLALCVAMAAQDRIVLTDAPCPCGHDPERFVSLVVDDLTGAPIAGAEVFLVRESETPMAGEFWFLRKGTTDADGVIDIPIDGIAHGVHMQVLRHPEFGTCTRSGRYDEVWRVGRGFDMEVLVRDWRGEPTPGAHIGFCGGCGHTPDLANAVTDGRGIAVLRGVDPRNHIRDIYVQHPGLGLGYDSVHWYPGGPPGILDCGYAAGIRGQVLDHLGKPVAGAFVSAQDVHRGPWGRTDDNGAFTVLGSRGNVSKVVTKDGRECYFASSDDPVVLRLADPDGDDPREGVAEPGPGSEPPSPVAVRVVQVQVEDDGSASCDFTRPCAERVHGPKGTVAVPEEGEFVIVVRDGYSRRYLHFDSIADLPPEPIVLRPFAATRIKARVVDAAGRPVDAEARLRNPWGNRRYHDQPELQPCAGGDLRLETRWFGPGLLEIRSDRDDLRPRLMWIMLPPRSDDAELDLGDIALAAAPQLRVRAADGSTIADAWVGFARAGM